MYENIKLIQEEFKKVKCMWMCFYIICNIVTLLHYGIEVKSEPWIRTYRQINQAFVDSVHLELFHKK